MTKGSDDNPIKPLGSAPGREGATTLVSVFVLPEHVSQLSALFASGKLAELGIVGMEVHPKTTTWTKTEQQKRGAARADSPKV
jgi:hypothetical protein